MVQSGHYFNEKIAVLQLCEVLESMIDEDMFESQIQKFALRDTRCESWISKFTL